MSIRRIYGGRLALARAMLALAVFLLFVLGAAVPGIPQIASTALAVTGYVLFICGMRSALLFWRRDWEELWRARSDPRRPPAIARFERRKFWRAAS